MTHSSSLRSTVLCVALIVVLAPAVSAQTISQAGWTLHMVDSQETEVCCYAATNAFDGNANTMWATRWSSASPVPPHDIQINLGAAYQITGFRYLPRQDGQPHGNIAQYQFYVSTDGAKWGPAVASGTFANSSTEKPGHVHCEDWPVRPFALVNRGQPQTLDDCRRTERAGNARSASRHRDSKSQLDRALG